MAKIIMDSGKEYNIYDGDIDNILYETVTLNGIEVQRIRSGLIRLVEENALISPIHISSIEDLQK